MNITHDQIFILFIVIMISLPGCDVELNSNTSNIKKLKKDNSIVKSVEQDLTSGEAFQLSFFAEKVRKQLEKSERKQKRMKQTRDLFSGQEEFQYVEGIKISGISNQPIIFPMKNETPEHPSMFRLPPKKKKQVYLIFTTDKNKYSYKFHILLWPEKGNWKGVLMRYFPSLRQLTYQSAIKKGKKEITSGDKLVGRALLSYAGMISGTPNFRTSGKQRKLRTIKEKLDVDSGMNSVEKINIEGKAFDVMGIRTVFLTKGVFVELNCPFPDVDSNEKVKRFQEKIAQQAYATHEKLQNHFQGIAISSKYTDENGDSTGYRSTHNFEKLQNK